MISESDEEAAACEIAQGKSSARLKLCYNCGELGHVKKYCPVSQVSDENRRLIDETIRARKKEAQRINRAKYRNSPKGEKKSENMNSLKSVKSPSSSGD